MSEINVICPNCGLEQIGKHYPDSIYTELQRIEIEKCPNCGMDDISIHFSKKYKRFDTSK